MSFASRNIFLVFFLVVGGFVSAKPREKSVEWRATRASFVYQRGSECKLFKEDKEFCKLFARGEGEYEILNANSCSYNFTTTDTKGWPTMNVLGGITALFLENITRTRVKARFELKPRLILNCI